MPEEKLNLSKSSPPSNEDAMPEENPNLSNSATPSNEDAMTEENADQSNPSAPETVTPSEPKTNQENPASSKYYERPYEEASEDYLRSDAQYKENFIEESYVMAINKLLEEHSDELTLPPSGKDELLREAATAWPLASQDAEQTPDKGWMGNKLQDISLNTDLSFFKKLADNAVLHFMQILNYIDGCEAQIMRDFMQEQNMPYPPGGGMKTVRVYIQEHTIDISAYEEENGKNAPSMVKIRSGKCSTLLSKQKSARIIFDQAPLDIIQLLDIGRSTMVEHLNGMRFHFEYAPGIDHEYIHAAFRSAASLLKNKRLRTLQNIHSIQFINYMPGIADQKPMNSSSAEYRCYDPHQYDYLFGAGSHTFGFINDMPASLIAYHGMAETVYYELTYGSAEFYFAITRSMKLMNAVKPATRQVLVALDAGNLYIMAKGVSHNDQSMELLRQFPLFNMDKPAIQDPKYRFCLEEEHYHDSLEPEAFVYMPATCANEAANFGLNGIWDQYRITPAGTTQQQTAFEFNTPLKYIKGLSPDAFIIRYPIRKSTDPRFVIDRFFAPTERAFEDVENIDNIRYLSDSLETIYQRDSDGKFEMIEKEPRKPYFCYGDASAERLSDLSGLEEMQESEKQPNCGLIFKHGRPECGKTLELIRIYETLKEQKKIVQTLNPLIGQCEDGHFIGGKYTDYFALARPIETKDGKTITTDLNIDSIFHGNESQEEALETLKELCLEIAFHYNRLYYNDLKEVITLLVDNIQFATPEYIKALRELADLLPNVSIICFGRLFESDEKLYPSSKLMLKLSDKDEEITIKTNDK